MKRKIIIDTDPGHDDAMAIMLAVQSGEFDIKAITTVSGNSTIENTTRNARFVLELLKKEDIPVYSGANKPLRKKLIQAVVHGKNGLEGVNPKNKTELTHNAVEKIISVIRANPGEITLVTLGPLTNIATAILKDSKTMLKIKEIISMGGAIKVAGNKNRVAEFNIFVDPDAAKIVMNFPVKKTLVPLDACNHVELTLANFKQIQNKFLREPLLKMVKPYIANLRKDAGVNVALMYDPLTIFYLLSPKSCRTKDYNIQIETKGEYTRGMTVADLRIVKDVQQPNCTIVEYIESSDFKRTFIHELSRI